MLGRYEDSYLAHSKCLVIKVRELGSDHIDVASSFFDIAITLKHLRRLSINPVVDQNVFVNMKYTQAHVLYSLPYKHEQR
jgi:hypothetical protein